ncbi:methylenetetrahydrofolate reductase [Cysteiniphilum halobium]|uniref:methylenetetrahydrofolate reductase n=1 Tax=Cysteiniphilum halobium TaxID=2219059 RepID=UPI000E647F60|nr:methylenetetrahydrofolate reductase [Cysteiniphilum halobium]
MSTTISFELFPSKAHLDNGKLYQAVDEIKPHTPKYVSVTFGAGGSSSYANSLTLIRYLRQHNIDVVPHITCFHLNKQAIFNLLREYIELGIDRLVVIRGDLPQDTQKQTNVSFNYAYQLIDYIRQVSGEQFDITIAAYPEFYPGSKTLQEDIDNLKQKINVGANHAITQYFYSIDAFYHFLQMCQEHQINIPITAGIMPIANYQGLKRFSQICHADIPQWLDKRLASYQHDPIALQDFASDVVAKLCDDLIDLGVHGLHFYTLNQMTATNAVIAKSTKLKSILGKNKNQRIQRSPKLVTVTQLASR